MILRRHNFGRQFFPWAVLTLATLAAAGAEAAPPLVHLWSAPRGNAVPSNVAFHRDQLIQLNAVGTGIEALSVADGERRWEHPLPETESLLLLVENDTLYGYRRDLRKFRAILFRFDLMTREMIWEINELPAIHSGLARLVLGKGGLAYLAANSELVLVSPESGKARFVSLDATQVSPSVSLSPEGNWIVGAQERLEVRNAFLGAPVWQLEARLPGPAEGHQPLTSPVAGSWAAHIIQGRRVGGVDLSERREAWSDDGPFVGSAAAGDDSFYLPVSGEGLRCYAAASGELLRSYSMPAITTTSHAALLSDTYLVGTGDTESVVFDRESGEPLQILDHGGHAVVSGEFLALSEWRGEMALYGRANLPLLQDLGQEQAAVGLPYKRRWPWIGARSSELVSAVTLLEGPSWLEPITWDESGILLRGAPSQTGEWTLQLEIAVSTGEVYRASLRLESGEFRLPRIERISADRNLRSGESTQLVAWAQGLGPLTWTWYRDGELLAEGTDPFLDLEGEDVAGTYQVEVTNPHGKVRSREVLVAVTEEPVGKDWWDHRDGGIERGRRAGTPSASALRVLWEISGNVQKKLEASVADDATVFLCEGSLSRGALEVVARNAHTGGERWRTSIFDEDISRGEAALARQGDSLYLWVLQGVGRGALYRLDAYTGEILVRRYATSFLREESPALLATASGVYVLVRKLGLELIGMDPLTLDPLFPGRLIVEGEGADPVMATDGKDLYLAFDGRFEARSMTDGALTWSVALEEGVWPFPPGDTFVPGVVRLDDEKAAVAVHRYLWLVDLVERKIRWVKDTRGDTARTAFRWPHIFTGTRDKVSVREAATGEMVSSLAAPSSPDPQRVMSSLAAAPAEVWMARDGSTLARQLPAGEAVAEWSFEHLLTSGGITVGQATAQPGGETALSGWASHTPLLVRNSISSEAYAGLPFEETLFTGTATEPPAPSATLLRGPDWLGLIRDHDGEWKLEGTPPLEALGHNYFLTVRFVGADGMAHEWSHQLTIARGGMPAVSLKLQPARPLPGDDVRLRASIEGQPPFTITWYRDGVEVARADGVTLHLADVTPADSGSYTVQVANGWGLAVSEPVRLVIRDVPLRWADGVQDPAGTASLPVALPEEPGEALWSFVSDADGPGPNAAAGLVCWLNSSRRHVVISAATLKGGVPLWSKILFEGNRSDATSGVVLAGGRAHVSWVTPDREMHLRVLDSLTGRELWKVNHAYRLGGGPTMLVDDESVWLFQSGQLTRFHGEDGVIAGGFPLTGTFDRRPLMARDDDVLVVLNRGHLAAYAMDEGTLLWTVPAPDRSLGPSQVAVAEDRVIARRDVDTGIEVFDRVSGEKRWQVDLSREAFAVAGGSLYARNLRVDLATGEREILLPEDGFSLHQDWRFVGKDHWYAQTFRDGILRTHLARPRLSSLWSLPERPRAVADGYMITQKLWPTPARSVYSIRRVGDERVASEVPALSDQGGVFAYRPRVETREGDRVGIRAVYLDQGPEWLEATRGLVTGRVPDGLAADVGVVIRIVTETGTTHFQPAILSPATVQPAFALSPAHLRAVPGEETPLFAAAQPETAAEVRVVQEDGEGGVTVAESPPMETLMLPRLTESASRAAYAWVARDANEEEVRSPLNLDVTWDALYGGDSGKPHPMRLPVGTDGPVTPAHHRWTRNASDPLFVASTNWRLTANHLVTLDGGNLEVWSRQAGLPAWRVELKGSAFLTTHRAIFVFHEGRVSAFSEDGGSVLWSRRVFIAEREDESLPANLALGAGGVLWLAANDPRGGPLVLGLDREEGVPVTEKMDFLDGGGRLVADGPFLYGKLGDRWRGVDSRTGEVLWEREDDDWQLLTVAQGLVTGAGDEWLEILVGATGETVWKKAVFRAGAPVFDGGDVYVAMAGGVARIDLWSGRIVAHSTDLHLPELTAVGDFLYAGDDSGGALRIDKETLAFVDVFEGGGRMLTDGRALVLVDEGRVAYHAPPKRDVPPVTDLRAGWTQAGVELSFPTVSGVPYEIQWSGDLIRWFPVDWAQPGSGDVFRWQPDGSAAGPGTRDAGSRHYRVRPIVP